MYRIIHWQIWKIIKNSITLTPQTQVHVQYNVVTLKYIYLNSTAYFFRLPFRKITSKYVYKVFNNNIFILSLLNMYLSLCKKVSHHGSLHSIFQVRISKHKKRRFPSKLKSDFFNPCWCICHDLWQEENWNYNDKIDNIGLTR